MNKEPYSQAQNDGASNAETSDIDWIQRIGHGRVIAGHDHIYNWHVDIAGVEGVW